MDDTETQQSIKLADKDAGHLQSLFLPEHEEVEENEEEKEKEEGEPSIQVKEEEDPFVEENEEEIEKEEGEDDGIHSLELAVDWLHEGLFNVGKLSRNEILEKFECILIEIKNECWLSRKWVRAEYDTLFDFIYTSFINLKSSQSSLQTCIDASDENLIKLIDSLLRLIMGQPELGIHPKPHIVGVLEKKLRLLRDLLSNELEIWEYLLTKIHNTVYGIALFELIFCYSIDRLEFPTVFLAIYLVCEIELLEQEIQEAYCKRNLKLEGLNGLTELVKYVEIFALVLRHNAIELLASMSCLFHHPQILYIHGELDHLKCFLEDLPKLDTRSHNLKDLLSQIGELNIKTRLVIHMLNVNGTTDGVTIIMDNELPFLIEKAKLIRSEIEKIPPLPQLPMPSHFPLTNGLGFIVSLLKNLTNLLKSKIDWIATNNDNMKLIYEELEKLSLFLKETSNQHTWHGFIDDLQRDIIQVAYKAECVVDSIMLNDGRLSDLIPELCYVNEEAKHINEKIATFHDEKKVGLNEKVAKFDDDKKDGHIVLASSKFMTNDEEVVGFEEETQIIIDQLTRGPVELDVISIIGMAGIGKTTLAHKVYSQREIIDHFHIQAWCTVSQNYDKKELLFETYKQVSRAKGKEIKDSNLTEDKVADNLRKSLMGNRYLIVLDDMWDTEVWDDFYRLLSPSEEHRSRIIITTRLDDVASYTKCHGNPLYLGPLNQEESLKLLLKKTFQNGNLPHELSGVGNRILQTCKGLPLMIVLAAGILSRLEPEARQWGEVAENLSSHITTGEDSMVVIELSYKHLPDYLKPCFLYFGAFKEDEEISVSKLKMLWIAEGFVRRSEQRVLEDVAKDHLNALISCSLVMVRRWGRCSGEAKVCVVHDLVHAFCLRKAKEENFLQWIREGDMSSWICDYRLSIGLESSDYNMIRLSWLRGSWVRSFVWTSFSTPQSVFLKKMIEPLWIFYKFKLLRILDLSSMYIHYSKLYSELPSLLHLRYLALRATGVHKFPSNLLNLETLLVRNEYWSRCRITLPRSIWRMVHLRHLKLPQLNLHGYGLEFFDGSSDLENLQCIATVELKYCEDDKNILRKFPNLRKIECKVIALWDDVEKCYQLPKLDFLHQLESLNMFGYVNEYPRRSDRYKFYLPRNLRRLKLGAFPVPWREISVIPTLANLEKLVLTQALQDKKWNVEDYVFPNLKILGLEILPIKEWVASANSFPCLEELVLRELYYLKEVPSCFEEIYTLRKIETFYCVYSIVASVMKIKEEIEEAGGALTIQVAATQPNGFATFSKEEEGDEDHSSELDEEDEGDEYYRSELNKVDERDEEQGRARKRKKILF